MLNLLANYPATKLRPCSAVKHCNKELK